MYMILSISLDNLGITGTCQQYYWLKILTSIEEKNAPQCPPSGPLSAGLHARKPIHARLLPLKEE